MDNSTTNPCQTFTQKLGKTSKLYSLKAYLIEYALENESIMLPFVIFGIIMHPMFYMLNLYLLAPQKYSDLTLRVFIVTACFLLTLKNYWPNKLRRYLPWVWYATVVTSMPLFATFMLLKNHYSAAWCLNFIALFILTMFLDWIPYVVLNGIGVVFGILLHYLTTPSPFPFSMDPTPLSFLDFLLTCVVSLVMGVIFSRKKALIEQGKLQALKVVGANIAHELRTPITSIEAGITGAKSYFPLLLDAYILAKKHRINVPAIPPKHMDTLLALLDALEEETRYSNTIIDMLLMRSKQREYNKANFTNCSIRHCISEALRRYPFKDRELALISWDNNQDFNFRGESLLILHVFFNLIKNALYFIEQEGRGDVKIWYERSPQYNIVHFRDTAKGVPAHVMPRLFERFYSYSNRGTGLGLAFCKMVMRGLEGDIKCKSNYGEFTDFILYFPRQTEIENTALV